MKKNARLLTILAVNSLAVAVGSAQTGTNHMKYKQLYRKIIKNLDENKSNDENYRLLEKVLNKRNKELKDLYLQNDYVIKPEYLEWQVFFTGFYNHSDKKGNKEERSTPFIENAGKVIDLGVVIPVKGRGVNEVTVNVLAPSEPEVNPSIGVVTAPMVSKPDFSFGSVEVPKGITLYSKFTNTFPGESFSKIGINTNNVRVNTSGTTIYENLNTASLGKTIVEADSQKNINITGATFYNNGVVSGTTSSSYTFGSLLTDTFSVISIGTDGNFSVSGDWEVRSKVLPSTYIADNYGFLGYRPYYITADGKVEFDGNLDITASVLTARQKVGLYLDLENQTNLPGVTATLENKGKITVTDTGTALQLNVPSKSRAVSGQMINSGTIDVNSSGTFNYHATGMQILMPSSEGASATVKVGNINVNGVNDDGIYVRSGSYGNISSEIPSNVIIDGSDGLLTLNGSRNQGLTVSRYMGPAGSTNGLDNIKNMNILVNGSDGVGMLVNPGELTLANDYVINDKIIKSIAFGPNSKSSSFFMAQYLSNGKVLILDESLRNSFGVIDTGTMNTIISMDTSSTVVNNASIEISENAKAMYALTTAQVYPVNFIPTSTIINNGNIINNSTPYTEAGYIYGAAGLGVLYCGGTVINTGNIDMNGQYAVGIFNKGNADSKSDHIIINNDKGVAVYGNFGESGLDPEYMISTSKISANKLEVNGENGAVLYSKAGNIELSPLVSGGSLEITANGKNTFAFYHETATRKLVAKSGKFIINDTVNVNLKNGGVGFYYNGNGGQADILGYFTNIVDASNGQLNVKADENSYNMAIGNATVNISNLSGLSIPNVSFIGNSGKTKVFSGIVNIDTDSDIDKHNSNGDKTYRNLEIGQSTITLQSGIKITGTEDSLVGIGQASRYNETPSYIINKGIIDLKGNSSIGVYNKRGVSDNSGIIEVSGTKGIGVYSVSDISNNTGEIRINDSGIGIYSTTYLDPSDNPYNYSYSQINNNGKIISGQGNKSIGIYADNNTSYGYMDMSLLGNSDIDVSSSKGGTGIYSNNANIYDGGSGSGKITVGKDGTGIYAKNSSVSLENLELNLYGDGAVGIYLDGTSSFHGTGNINIAGKGITVFNVANTGNFDQNFNITSTADSSYTFQNLKNRTSYYNSTASLGQGGVFIYGENSAVLLDVNSELVSSNSDLVALALDGSYSGLTNINGIPVINEATNKGKISFGDNSAGLYVKNGATALNEGTITLGGYSVALYGTGAGTSVTNTGDVSIGQNSTGLFLKNGDKLINSGEISGNGSKTTGLFLSGLAVSEIQNTGKINLSGSESVGIYTNGTQTNIINNSGEIITGDLGVGIFNDNINGTAGNSADITGGNNSVGLYNNGGTINHLTGDINTGSNGVGVYSKAGIINLSSGKLNVDNFEEVGIYGKNGAKIDNNMEMNIGQNNYGIILDSGSALINRNRSILGKNSVLLYSNNGNTVINEANAHITMTDSDSIAFYMENGGDLSNKASITGDSGTANIGIYTKGSNVNNSGDIKVGDSLIIDAKDPAKNFYSVGVYSENAGNFKNTGNIKVGSDAIGIYVGANENEAENSGNIVSDSNGAIGIYTVKGTLRNTGDITLSGDKSLGIAASLGSKISNAGKITMDGNSSTGIYADMNSKVINEITGSIYINGNDSTGIQLSGGSTLENYGTIEIAAGTIGSVQISTGTSKYEIPSIINAGVIKVDEKFDLNGLELIIRADADSFRKPEIEEVSINNYSMEDLNAGFLLTNTVKVVAPEFDFGTKAVKIDPLFTQGTNARVYKFENVFDPLTPEGGLNSGELNLKSISLTFDAIPNINSSGKVDIWMEKINYDQFTQGLWYDDFAKNIENKYLNATGDALKLYDKLDLINNINDFDNSMRQLAGNMYANINQREQDIYGSLDNALITLQNSTNNTKENVKINVIAGKGSTKEDTSGVDSYDYDMAGVLALREVERTYKHTFGYSLGYARTDFQIKDAKYNEDQANTVQIGLHNKYKTNGWNFKSDLLGRVSFHSSDRSVLWYDGSRDNMKADYNVYGVNLLNEAGKDFELGKSVTVTPYAGLELGYMRHEGFEETGDSARLQVDGNDGYSVKPSVGVSVAAEKSLGKNEAWKLKGNLGVGYEYELGNMNKQEQVSVAAIEEKYHKLAQPEDDKGRIKTKGIVGVEVQDRYGIFVTGEYGIGNGSKEDYKLGISLKAVF